MAEFPLSALSLFVIALPLALIFFYLKCCYWPFQVLKRNGFPGPTPSFFIGNYRQIVKAGGAFQYMQLLHREYGNVAGFYVGQRPFVMVTGLELIKLITVKDFDYFPERIVFPNLTNDQKGMRNLVRLTGDEWKSARLTISPTFSSLKMKKMTPIIKNIADVLVEILEEHADKNQSVEVLKIYGAFTMETIIATAFGRLIDIQKGQSDKLGDAAANFFTTVRERSSFNVHFITMILSNLPWLQPVLKLVVKRSKILGYFTTIDESVFALIQERRKEMETKEVQTKHIDFLQQLMDAPAIHNGEKMTDDELIAHSVMHLMAGYETTANALSYTSYLLALNPEVQEKLQADIDAYFEEDPDASLYDAAQDLEYLDMVVLESLRLHPPAPHFSRTCVKDYTYEGLTFPKGCTVQFSASTLHKNEKYWTEPEVFDPLRFTAEEKAKRPHFCYVPFGSGPRSCIGMKLALLETKIAFITLLRKYSFQRAPDTQVPLKTVLGFTMSPLDGIYLRVTTR